MYTLKKNVFDFSFQNSFFYLNLCYKNCVLFPDNWFFMNLDSFKEISNYFIHFIFHFLLFRE